MIVVNQNVRRVAAAATGILVLVGGVAAAWFWWVPNHRPRLAPGETYGIDISAHQGRIDWDAVASDGVSFAYIKATEGGDFVDDRFEENWKHATAVGLERGAYHFFTLCTSGQDQADNFLRIASPKKGALAPAVDLELAGNCTARPPVDDVISELIAFLKRVETAWGGEMVLYVGDDWEDRYPVRQRLERLLWLRRFLLRPDEPWHIWQLHGYAQVDGIEGPVDLNVMSR